MKIHRKIWQVAVIAAVFCCGCGAKGKTENINAGMEQVAALEYDSALESFQLAQEAGNG